MSSDSMYYLNFNSRRKTITEVCFNNKLEKSYSVIKVDDEVFKSLIRDGYLPYVGGESDLVLPTHFISFLFRAYIVPMNANYSLFASPSALSAFVFNLNPNLINSGTGYGIKYVDTVELGGDFIKKVPEKTFAEQLERPFSKYATKPFESFKKLPTHLISDSLSPIKLDCNVPILFETLLNIEMPELFIPDVIFLLRKEGRHTVPVRKINNLLSTLESILHDIKVQSMSSESVDIATTSNTPPSFVQLFREAASFEQSDTSCNIVNLLNKDVSDLHSIISVGVGVHEEKESKYDFFIHFDINCPIKPFAINDTDVSCLAYCKPSGISMRITEDREKVKEHEGLFTLQKSKSFGRITLTKSVKRKADYERTNYDLL